MDIMRMQSHISELDSAISDLHIANAMNETSKIDLGNLIHVRDSRINKSNIQKSINPINNTTTNLSHTVNMSNSPNHHNENESMPAKRVTFSSTFNKIVK